MELRLPMRLRPSRCPTIPRSSRSCTGRSCWLPISAARARRREALRPAAPELRADEAPPMPDAGRGHVGEALAHLQPAGGPLRFRSRASAGPESRAAAVLPASTTGATRCTCESSARPRWPRARARAAAAAAARRAVEARTVDRVAAGVAAEETAHGLEQERAGAWSLEGRSCRRRATAARRATRSGCPRGARRGARQLLGRRDAPPPLRGDGRRRDDRDAGALRRPPRRALPVE